MFVPTVRAHPPPLIFAVQSHLRRFPFPPFVPLLFHSLPHHPFVVRDYVHSSNAHRPFPPFCCPSIAERNSPFALAKGPVSHPPEDTRTSGHSATIVSLNFAMDGRPAPFPSPAFPSERFPSFPKKRSVLFFFLFYWEPPFFANPRACQGFFLKSSIFSKTVVWRAGISVYTCCPVSPSSLS